MYYSEFEKVKRMERLLEKLAYLSVVLDFFVAAATFFVIKGADFSSFMLLLSGYLILAEVIIAGVLFFALVALRHYRVIADRMALVTFRRRYGTAGPKTTTNLLIKPFARLFSLLD